MIHKPYESGFLSQYKNLIHHYVHQQSNSNANTFWAGCGAVKKDIFMEVGGFDGKRYPTSSIEDIELGYRIKSAGYRICLFNDIQVKHLKKWSIKNYLGAEIFRRAIPWSRLLVETNNLHTDLNLKISDRVSAFVVWVMILNLILIITDLFSKDVDTLFYKVFVLFLALVLFLILNFKFYKFLLVNRGLSFLFKSIPVHILYFIYSSLAFALMWINSKIKLPL